MKIQHGKGRTQYGPGVDIRLTGNEVAQAILDYIEAQGINVTGPRTVMIDGELCPPARVYVDPSGHVTFGESVWNGRGGHQEPAKNEGAMCQCQRCR